MFKQEIWYKTSKGREELTTRHLNLPRRLRAALVLIDGKTPWETLQSFLAPLGDAEDIVHQLADYGLIESDHELPPVHLMHLGELSQPADHAPPL